MNINDDKYCNLFLRDQKAVSVPTPTDAEENSKCFNGFDENDNTENNDDVITTRTLPILALNEVRSLNMHYLFMLNQKIPVSNLHFLIPS